MTATAPRQALVAHLTEFHRSRVKITTHDTVETLGRKHGRDHHHYAPRNHRHEGVNLGPNHRPPGWKTGLDVVDLRKATP
jgi:hypothetical protein